MAIKKPLNSLIKKSIRIMEDVKNIIIGVIEYIENRSRGTIKMLVREL